MSLSYLPWTKVTGLIIQLIKIPSRNEDFFYRNEMLHLK
jgi:hypothetical protein